MDIQALTAELKSDECVCGGFKERKKTFCNDCWNVLPRSQQRALYLRIGEGYEAARAEAFKTIKDSGRLVTL